MPEMTTSVGMTRVGPAAREQRDDIVAIEEPLEIRAAWGKGAEAREKNISVTMRTPGDDYDLAVGFLFTEGMIRAADEIEAVRHWGSPNRVRVSLAPHAKIDTSRLERHFYTTSSCGVCGKTSIEAVRVACSKVPSRGAPDAAVILRLPEMLQSAQPAFRATGSVHGAALFDGGGTLLRSREDIGRHNAVDKVIGSFLREGAAPPADAILAVSSRMSFEIVQKAIVAGISTVAAVGGPSSLAIDLARDFGVTLLAFVRDGRFNIYTGEVR
ncbi:MAG TPA: formate dehydrogenase accessory sulfurtransferase FdhD [Thermoanaerobaculia bacterium]|nr:formate dehydrogenase accessory sulfurtransferase FdhD [Thermoanaerobaculia bacterium]